MHYFCALQLQFNAHLQFLYTPKLYINILSVHFLELLEKYLINP